MNEPIHIISLGAGVQSSAMALMACHGVIKPMPQCAIFADTGDEPREVYLWLKELCRMLTFQVVWLKMPSLSDSLVNSNGHSQIPSWIKNTKGGPSLGKRQCTKYFKILPVRHEIRSRYPGQDVTLWHGISTDEATRAKDSDRQWLTHRFPLLEHRLSRHDCRKYLESKTSWQVPKSACVHCPYRSGPQWRRSLEDPYELGIIRKVESVLLPRGEFLSDQLKPIEQCDFSTEEERGQINLFENECEGMCGV